VNETTLGGRSILQQQEGHPEWDRHDPKHVPWSAAFVHSKAGVRPGQRALLRSGQGRDALEPCEILGWVEGEEKVPSARVHFPRTRTSDGIGAERLVSVQSLEPYCRAAPPW